MALSLACSQFQAAVRDLVAGFPAGQYRAITIDLLAASICFLKASFTFLFHGDEGDARDWDTVTYGQWNSKIYSSAYIADVKEWLLDEDECLTEYDVLQKLRQQHNDN